jgi:MFS family permease
MLARRVTSTEQAQRGLLPAAMADAWSSAGNVQGAAKKREPTFFLVLFVAIATVNYIDRGALNGALTNVKTELCLSTVQEGTVVSAFTVGYIAAAPLFAHLSGTPRRGRQSQFHAPLYISLVIYHTKLTGWYEHDFTAHG